MKVTKRQLQKIIKEELQKLLQEYNFGDRRAIDAIPRIKTNLPTAALTPLPADEMDELMGIVHGPRGSGTIYDQERILGTLDNKLDSGEIDQEEYDYMRTKALMGDIWDFDPKDS